MISKVRPSTAAAWTSGGRASVPVHLVLTLAIVGVEGDRHRRVLRGSDLLVPAVGTPGMSVHAARLATTGVAPSVARLERQADPEVPALEPAGSFSPGVTTTGALNDELFSLVDTRMATDESPGVAMSAATWSQSAPAVPPSKTDDHVPLPGGPVSVPPVMSL